MLATRLVQSGLKIVAPLLTLVIVSVAQAPTPEPVTDQETELGMAMYQQLRDKGEIIETSPLYDSLAPITDAIARVAQPQYPHPFKFFLVHETQPNAFATPGGNVYVVDSLLRFVKNKQELAGTLCHEVSHTIHRDGVNLMEKEKKIEEREVAAAILLGPTRAHLIAIALIARLNSLGYSREAESKADVTGSDICAAADSNPWGLVWLFQDFQNADVKQLPQLLSDHPADGTRIKTLEDHFRKNPGTFSKFSGDAKSATPFTVPKDAPAVFLPPAPKGKP
jgi:predicted Zn-dependent protease